MATITGYKTTAANWSWSDNFKIIAGPTVQLESESLDLILKQLPALWSKHWKWAVIETASFIVKVYNPNGTSMSQTFIIAK